MAVFTLPSIKKVVRYFMAEFRKQVLRKQWGWSGTVEEFLETPPKRLLESLEQHHLGLFNQKESHSQKNAWKEEITVMRSSFRDVCIALPDARHWGIVFEYEIPLEGGRRPDVVVLAGSVILVLEFKQSNKATASALDQVDAYVRDLQEYHEETHGISALPVLVLTSAENPDQVVGCRIVDSSSLAALIISEHKEGSIALERWLNSEYAPLPMLVVAARRIFQNEPLPAIKRALSSSVPQAVELLGLLAEDAAENNDRVLAFVAGVPGSGKTLAGLSLVYERIKRMSSATFLSGNGPLVEVLRDALKSEVFVKDLHAFIRTYGLSEKVPKEHVIVFDEAQRAWDLEYMKSKRNISRSEPDLLVDVGERLPGWATLVGLIGDGQEIHAGEEAGVDQWKEAIDPKQGRQEWKVHCPPRIASSFEGMSVEEHAELDLTISLRSRRADYFHEWVVSLLSGDLARAARLAESVRAAGFPLYVSRDLSEAKNYVWDRYADQPDARYGLLVSARSKQGFLEKYGIDDSWPASKRVKLARWYNEPLGHPQSCCALNEVVTEFGCQGLELDFPIICWGNDMMWDGKDWKIRQVKTKYPLDNPEQIRKNAYRVLLTRGRDGALMYLPPDPILDSTEHALLASGVRPLIRNYAEGSEAIRM